MPSPRIMFCGASDTAALFTAFQAIAATHGFLDPIHFVNGEFDADNHRGIAGFQANSIESLKLADVVVFVVFEKYGPVTWEAEFPFVLQEGKNYLVFAAESAYQAYRAKDHNKLDQRLIELFSQMEWGSFGSQVTINTFREDNLREIINANILNLIRDALQIKQLENAKKSFVYKKLIGPEAGKFLNSDLNEANEAICKRILFDPFEPKELRKRALDFFTYSHSLSSEELVRLCLDFEQGVSRKSISILPELIGNRPIDLEALFDEVLSSIASENDVGVTRRAIKTFAELDIRLAVKYFRNLFPASDVGTPKRVIFFLRQNWEQIFQIVKEESAFRSDLVLLIELCKDRDDVKGDWKKVADELLGFLSDPNE